MPRSDKARGQAPRHWRLAKCEGGSCAALAGDAGMNSAGESVLRGVAVCSRGEALGHGFWLDDTFLASVHAGILAAGAEGIKSRFTHPGLSSDGLGKYLGRIRNGRFDQAAGIVRGDLHLSPLAADAPDGDLAGYVAKLAAADPKAFGLSIVFERDRDAEEAFSLANGGRWERGEFGPVIVDFQSPDPANVNNHPHARLKALLAADAVDEPAANPSGLFHRGQDLPREAEALLAYAVGLSARAPAVAALDVHPDRAKRFVSGFLARHGLAIVKTSKEKAMPKSPCKCGGKCESCKGGHGATGAGRKPKGLLATLAAAIAAGTAKVTPFKKRKLAEGDEPIPTAENPDGSEPADEGAEGDVAATMECGCFMVDEDNRITGKVESEDPDAEGDDEVENDPGLDDQEEPKMGKGKRGGRAELARFMDAFGDAQGAKWFREGKSFESCTAAFLKSSREAQEKLARENAKLQAKVNEGRGGEPLDLGGDDEESARDRAKRKLASSPLSRIAAGCKPGARQAS